MALTDSLRILITANGAQAEREFQKVGAAARTNLGAADTSAQRFGRSLTSAGVAMAVFGGVALVGLYRAAQAAQEEDLAIAKLNNSIANSPELAGASSDAFLDLASSMQDVTTFTDDAVISAEAMLGTFHLTESEILSLTPLVADLASKFDMDLTRSSMLVGKAMDGNIGALQRMGVNIDETAYATDRFAAVTQALRENVGGFAETEGATFNGQMTILKNNLGDIAEGVGRGAVEAFNSMLGPVKAVSNAFQDMSPATQSMIGKVAAFGATGLVAAGSVSFLAGQALTMVDRFRAMAEAAKTAKIAAAGLSVGILGAAAAAAVWANAQTELQADWDIDGILGASDAEVERAAMQFQIVASAAGDTGEALDAFSELADRNLSAATRVGEAWAAAGGPVAEIDTVLEEAGRAAELAALGLDESASSAEETAAAMGQLNDQIDEYLNRIQGVEEAAAAEAEAQQAWADSLRENGHSYDINTEAGRTNIQMRNSWVDTVAGQIQATIEHARITGNYEQAQRDANRAIQSAIGDLRSMKDAGLITQEQFNQLSGEIRRVPHNVPVNIHTNVQTAMVQVASLQNSLWELERTYSIPISIVNPDYLPGRSSGRSSNRSRGRSADRSGGSDEFARSVARELSKTTLGVVVVG